MNALVLDLEPCAMCSHVTTSTCGGLPLCGECWCDVRETAGITYPALRTSEGQAHMETALYAALAGKHRAA